MGRTRRNVNVHKNLDKLKSEMAEDDVKVKINQEKEHTNQNQNGISNLYINRGWLDYFRLTSRALLKESEDQILASLKTPWESKAVNIGPIFGGPDCRISTLCLNTESHNTPIVFVHGLGAGIAMWVLNLDELAKDRPVYAIDLLGFGRSSRPTFSSSPLEAETQIARSIEEWRIQMKLEKIIICGHSFGAYLSTAYSLMYPDKVSRLILVDPWGMKDKPEDLTRTPFHFRLIVRLLQDMNPLSVIRIAGYLGPKLIQKIRPDLSQNYQDLVEDAKRKISNYLYHCNARNPTGETAYHTLMSCLAWAKYPMGHRLPNLDEKIALTIIYGSETWLDHIPFEEIKEMRANSECSTHIVVGGGHHLYAEKKDEFNQILVKDCKATDSAMGVAGSRKGKRTSKVQITRNFVKRRKGSVLFQINERSA